MLVSPRTLPTPGSSPTVPTSSSARSPRPARHRPRRAKTMRMKLVPFLVLLLAGPVLAPAQSLGEVAKREQEKQEKKKKKSGKPPATVKVYTDEDLKKAREAESGAVTVLPENG